MKLIGDKIIMGRSELLKQSGLTEEQLTGIMRKRPRYDFTPETGKPGGMGGGQSIQYTVLDLALLITWRLLETHKQLTIEKINELQERVLRDA